MVGKIYSNKFDPHDHLFYVKAIVNSNNNYLHDKTREDKERLFTKFYFAISLLLTILAASFTEYLGWVSILLLTFIIVVFLGISVLRYRKQRKIFWDNRKEMKQTFEGLEIPWKD